MISRCHKKKISVIFHIVSFHWNHSLLYFGQIFQKCCSSSISFILYWEHFLTSGGSPVNVYLPPSIFNWCAEMRSLFIFFFYWQWCDSALYQSYSWLLLLWYLLIYSYFIYLFFYYLFIYFIFFYLLIFFYLFI